MYSVYMLRVPDGRVYIGATSNVKRRWNNGNGFRFKPELWNLIVRYGWARIDKMVLADGLTKDEASMIEQEKIKQHMSYKPEFGFNREMGGLDDKKNIPVSVRERMRESCTGKKNHNYGKHFSEEHKAKISESNRGQKRSDETRARIGNVKKKPVSQYTLNGRLIATFSSGKEAAIETGVSAAHISKVCKGQRSTAGGYVWLFA